MLRESFKKAFGAKVKAKDTMRDVGKKWHSDGKDKSDTRTWQEWEEAAYVYSSRNS